jgi:2-oxoglutarate dehydrogenase E1 component
LKASNQNAKKVKRIVLCSGKVYYDLMEQAAERSDVAVIPVEQLYPFPAKTLAETLEIYDSGSEVVWCQEEPENMGAWRYMDRRLEAVLESLKFKNTRVRYAGRDAAAATASGYPALHTHKQQKLIEQALKR